MYRAGSLRSAFLAIVASAILLALGVPAVTTPATPDSIASQTCSAHDDDLRLKQ